MDLNYNTTVPQGGFGQGIPGQIAALRSSQPKSVLSSLFNAPVAMRNRMNDQQMGELAGQQAADHRNTAWGAANNLERGYQQANQQMMMNQLQGAAGNAMNYFDTANGALNQYRQQELQAQRSLPWLGLSLSQLFNGGMF